MFDKNECLKQISNFCRKCVAIGKCSDGDCMCCCINYAYEAIRDETFGEKADLVLEADVYELDLSTGNIKVDKDVFDDFVQNTYINIRFVDDNVQGRVTQYKMISEDDDGIIMEYMEG